MRAEQCHPVDRNAPECSILASMSQIPTGEFSHEAVMLRVGQYACHATL